MSCYEGKIKNTGSQEVKGVYGNKSGAKHPTVKKGEDLRSSKESQK